MIIFGDAWLLVRLFFLVLAMFVLGVNLSAYECVED